MTEAEWLDCTDPRRMLEFLRGKASDRKLRLFAVACCRKIWRELTDNRLRAAAEMAERFLQGTATHKELESARAEANEASGAAYESGDWSLWAASQPAFAAVAEDPWQELTAEIDDEEDAEKAVRRTMNQVPLLREVFGNPFRSVDLDPVWMKWRDGTIPRLAQAIYDERAFDCLPILADALEEAGCDRDDVLVHCRQPRGHVRGCWVIDAILRMP